MRGRRSSNCYSPLQRKLQNHTYKRFYQLAVEVSMVTVSNVMVVIVSDVMVVTVSNVMVVIVSDVMW